MKNCIISRVIAAVMLCFVAHAVFAGEDFIRITTYNIRRLGGEKNKNYLWSNRKQLVFNTIDEIQPDIIGFQEVVAPQFDDLRAALPGFGSLGESRGVKTKSWWQKFVMMHKDAKDEHNPIFYNKETMEFVKGGTFPINPRARVMRAHLPRVCTWGLFKDKDTGKNIYVYNTHLDNSSGLIRRRQIAKITKHVKNQKTGTTPVIIMGDFNTKLQGKNKLRLMTKAGFTHAKLIANSVIGPRETRTGWENGELKMIDHIFVRPITRAVEQYVVVESPRGVFPSDHRPVYIDMTR